MASEVYMTREGSVSAVVERMIQDTTTALDAALYRFDSPCLAQALEGAARRAVRIRLVLDHGKYEEAAATRELLARTRVPFRLLYGRKGPRSKLHHKFAILDSRTVLTGSYNWTLESEEQNYDHMLVLRESTAVETYRREFEALWDAGKEV